jgi:hypothetical protein
MILAKLPLVSNRSAMSVSKQFWAVLNPDAEHHLCGIKGALGLEFSRSIESLTDSEKADLWGHAFTPLQILEPRLEWLVNFELDLAYVDRRHAPFLKIWPFVFDRMTGSLKHQRLDISLRLDAEDIDREYMGSKGVYTPSKGRTMIYGIERGLPARNWMDVKLLNMPLKVMISVAVDFRKCMGAPSHHEGICRVPGCQVGMFGVQVRPALINLGDVSNLQTLLTMPSQRTFTTLTPEKATMGEFIAFLDRIEHDSRNIAASIARRSLRYGPGFLGQNYYLGTSFPLWLLSRLLYSSLRFITGSSVPPPSLEPQYTGDYTLNALQYQPSKRTLDQMTPRSLREILFPEEFVSKGA